MMRSLFACLASFLLVLSAGCATDSGPPLGVDAGHTDGGTADAAAADTGVGRDGGQPMDGGGVGDGATPDAGPPVDASTPGEGGAIDGGADAGPVSMPCTAAGTCDPFDPTACPSGESCRPSTTMGVTCQATTASPAAENAPCASPQDCQQGLLCLDFGAGAGFTCQRMCPDGSIGFCGDGRACIGTLGGPCIRVCRPIAAPCDIYAQDCPDSADTCTFARNPETLAPYTGCLAAGTQASGDPCSGMAGTCDHGLVCIRDADGQPRCHQVCSPSGTPSCTDATQSCVGMARTWMVSYCR